MRESGKPNILTVHEPTQGSQMAIKTGVSAAQWRVIGCQMADEEIAYYLRSILNGWPLSSAAKRALACVRATEGEDGEEGDRYTPASSFTRDLLAAVPAKEVTA